MSEAVVRVGVGYDVHRLKEGRKLIIGGVDVPSRAGLDGHSDADVLCHAVTDAILGAASMGNIGTHFPNDDPGLKNISSIELLTRANLLLKAGGWAVINVDSTVNIEKPKLAPYIHSMRENIATALGINPDSVSVKATSGEGIGFIGSGEGAAAYAVALIRTGEMR
jgi:2-C-methyl-D-erythritol 2,4-cyclodiphosphate synthase